MWPVIQLKIKRNLRFVLTGKNVLYNNCYVHSPHSNTVGHFIRALNTIRNGLCRGGQTTNQRYASDPVHGQYSVSLEISISTTRGIHSRCWYATSRMWSWLRFRPPFELVSSPQVMIQARAERQFPPRFSCGWSRMQAGWNGPPQLIAGG